MRSFQPEWERATGNQLGIAFECTAPAEVDEVYAVARRRRLQGREGALGCILGQRYALLVDPDGVEVSLYAAL